MTGCRHNAKNTLVKNYLYLAEKNGAEIHPLTTVVAVRPLPGGGYEVETRRTNRRFRPHRTITAEQVVFAASTMGTQKLLHRMRDRGILPHVSERLGLLTRTNSEALLGAIADKRDVDYSHGVAITSSFHPDEHTHVEPVRYGKGSNAMSLMQTVLTDGSTDTPRWRVWLRELWRQKRQPVQALRPAALVGAHDHRPGDADARQLHHHLHQARHHRPAQALVAAGPRGTEPVVHPAGHEAVQHMARHMGGTAGGTIGEPFNMPMTAHFMGGCAIGDSPETGVIDPYHRLYGHEGLHVVDGSAISANLGVNPSLTITAQAERAMAMWPNSGETDTRPALGEAYRRVEPVQPKSPDRARRRPGRLRLPIVGRRTEPRKEWAEPDLEGAHGSGSVCATRSGHVI